MKKLLVCAHIFYHEQTDYVIEKLKNITCPFDLCVTYVTDNNETINKFENFKNDTKFIKVDNVGYDIYPFIRILDEINLDDYEYVLKLHTKNHSKKGDYVWRDELYDSLLGTKNIFKFNLRILDKNKRIGMIGSKARINAMMQRFPENTILFDEVCKRFNISNEHGHFIAGTIFLIRAELLKIIKDFNLKKEDFEGQILKTGSQGTMAHAVERLLGVMVERQGYEIYGSDKIIPFSKTFYNKITRTIFSIQNCFNIKTIMILGFPIRINRYRYKIEGCENSIVFYDDNDKDGKYLKKGGIDGLDIKINGNGNLIKVHRSAKFKNVSIEINSSINDIVFSKNSNLENVKIILNGDINKLFEAKENSFIKDRTVVLDKRNESVEL